MPMIHSLISNMTFILEIKSPTYLSARNTGLEQGPPRLEPLRHVEENNVVGRARRGVLQEFAGE